MHRLLATVARYALVTIVLAFSSLPRCEADAFSKWAAAHAVPLRTVESTQDFSDLLPLKSVVGSARVVALGETTHGAHEPLAFRNRLIRFLVAQMGFTAVALESGFTESSIVDRFVGGGPGDMRSVLRSGLSSGFGRYGENRELVQWMRDYNIAAAAAGHRRIRFYGIDLTAGGRISGTTLAIDSALAYLSRADRADAESIRSSLGDSLPSNDWKWGVLPQAAQRALDSSIPKIASAMARNRGSLIAHSSTDAYRRALQNLEVSRQLAQCERVTTPESFRDIRYSGPVIGCRDRAMAANVRWILENEGPQGRILVFAHNGHVMNWQEDGGYWAGMRERPFMMGAHLRRAYGKSLLIIATCAAGASAGLPMREPIADSIDDTVARIGLPKLLLDLRMARQDSAALAWLSTQRPLRANIDSHFLVTPATAVDVLVFLGRLTPANLSSDKTP